MLFYDISCPFIPLKCSVDIPAMEKELVHQFSFKKTKLIMYSAYYLAVCVFVCWGGQNLISLQWLSWHLPSPATIQFLFEYCLYSHTSFLFKNEEDMPLFIPVNL